jgi:2-dehydro-3-deoxygalactonokinase
MGEPYKLCLDVGITQTRVWLVDRHTIIAKASTMQGIRGGADAAAHSIDETIQACLRSAALGEESRIDFIAAAGMVTSELGPYFLPHLHGATGIERLAKHVVKRQYVGCVCAPLFVVPGLRFGDAENRDERDGMRGEETLFFGLQDKGLIHRGEGLLNLGSHWKLIVSNAEGEIQGSYTGIGGELALAISRETLLKSALPEVRPSVLNIESLKRGEQRSVENGLGRSLFLLRMDTQNEPLTQEAVYWQMLGAIVGDALPFIVRQLRHGDNRRVLIAGYSALASGWAYTLSGHGIGSTILTDGQIEESFCAGLVRIVESAMKLQAVS